MIRHLIFLGLLIPACGVDVAPITIGALPCVQDSDCSDSMACHQGYCLKRLERQCNLNGIIDGAEECDDGNQDDDDDCTNQCRYAFCGDGTRRNTLDEAGKRHEECDYAQDNPWQYCTRDCRLAIRPRRLAAGKGFTCYLKGQDVTCWGANFEYPNHGIDRAEFYSSGDEITNIDVVETVAWTEAYDLGSPFYQLGLHVNRPVSHPPDQLTRRYPSLFLSTRNGRTDLYPWPFAYVPTGTEVVGLVENYKQNFGEIGRFRSRKMRGFWPYGHADDRAGCWINEDFKLRCMMRGDCRSFPSRRDRDTYFGVNLGRLGSTVDVSLSRAAACTAELGGGQVLCWGDTQGWGLPDTSRCTQQSGERIGRRADEARDAEALPGVEFVVQLSAGEHHHLGLTDQGDVFEWGWDWQLEEIMVPKLHQFDELAIAVAGAHQTRCVLFLSGKVGCWGRFRGSPDGPGDELHIVEGLPPIVELLDGWQNKHICVLTEDERVFCWGKNNLGQLGDFSGIDEDLPIEIDLSLAD